MWVRTAIVGTLVAAALWISLLRFFNVGDVPLMVLVSVLVFTMWTIAILGNHYFNPDMDTTRSLILVIPNLVLSLLVTKVVTTPIRHLFRHANAGVEAPLQMVGKTCIVTTGEVTSKFGQAEIAREGSPVTINVCCPDGQVLKKGDEAVITEHIAEKKHLHGGSF